jgi:hypothetical protein
MNGAFKWIVGGMASVILAGASWNETEQHATDKDHDKRIQQVETAVAIQKDNAEKLDKVDKKLDCLIDKKFCPGR